MSKSRERRRGGGGVREMIELDSCIIGNFKSLNEFTLDFSKFTCLIGLNSAGKSTILQSLDFISQQMKGDISGWLKSRNWEAKELKCKFINNKYIILTLLYNYKQKNYIWNFIFNPLEKKSTHEEIVYFPSLDSEKSKIIFEVKASKYMIDKDGEIKKGDIIVY